MMRFSTGTTKDAFSRLPGSNLGCKCDCEDHRKGQKSCFVVVCPAVSDTWPDVTVKQGCLANVEGGLIHKVVFGEEVHNH